MCVTSLCRIRLMLLFASLRSSWQDRNLDTFRRTCCLPVMWSSTRKSAGSQCHVQMCPPHVVCSCLSHQRPLLQQPAEQSTRQKSEMFILLQKYLTLFKCYKPSVFCVYRPKRLWVAPPIATIWCSAELFWAGGHFSRRVTERREMITWKNTICPKSAFDLLVVSLSSQSCRPRVLFF